MGRVVWVRAGVEQPWRGARSVAWGLSTACDEAYPDGPRLRNELLNRRVLSSAAAAARRELINRMCAASDQPRLGIVGAPPEWSMYASLNRLLCSCPADCDHSGSLDIDDFICFQSLYAVGDLASDCDEDGALTIDDFACFQAGYAVGC